MTITTALSNVGEVVTAMVGYFGDILEMFVTEPVLLIGVAVFFVSAVIGLVMRLVKGY